LRLIGGGYDHDDGTRIGRMPTDQHGYDEKTIMDEFPAKATPKKNPCLSVLIRVIRVIKPNGLIPPRSSPNSYGVLSS